MAVKPVELIPSKVAESSQTTQYTATAATAYIDKFTVTNTGATAVQFSANLSAGAEPIGAQNLIINKRTIGPGETYLCPELVGQVLAAGSLISTLSSAASGLTIRASGREIT